MISEPYTVDNRMNNLGKIILTLLLSLCSSLSNANQDDNLFDLTIEQLLNLTITTAGKRQEKISDIPASVTIVTRLDIANYGYTTLVEVLEHIPGLYNIDNYFSTPGNFGTRGFWNPREQNASFAILVNGVNQVRVDTRNSPFSKITVPVESIDRIEFIRGPMSVMYGNLASFGVINIITNQSEKYMLTHSRGSKNTYNTTIRTGFIKNSLAMTFDVSDYSTHGYNYKFSDMSEGDQLAGQISLMPNAGFTTEKRLEHNSRYFHVV